MSIIRAPSIVSYWSKAPLYHGLWARTILGSKIGYKQITCFLKITDCRLKDPTGNLGKVRYLYNVIECKH